MFTPVGCSSEVCGVSLGEHPGKTAIEPSLLGTTRGDRPLARLELWRRSDGRDATSNLRARLGPSRSCEVGRRREAGNAGPVLGDIVAFGR